MDKLQTSQFDSFAKFSGDIEEMNGAVNSTFTSRIHFFVRTQKTLLARFKICTQTLEMIWATIGFGFTSDWLKKWRENLEPITENHLSEVMQNQSNSLITFDTQLKTTRNRTISQPMRKEH